MQEMRHGDFLFLLMLRKSHSCNLLRRVGKVLKLGRVATSTTMVFFHRFFSRHGFSDHNRFEVAVACVLLAAKTEECPRKLSHVIQGKITCN